MKDIQKLDKSKLAKSKIIKKENLKEAKIIIKDEVNPIPRLIAMGYVVEENFYPSLASLFKLDYIQSIPVNANSEKSIIHQIPTDMLIKNKLFVYESQAELVIVSSNPFVSYEIIFELLSYTAMSEHKLVISNPNAITNSLNKTFYQYLDFISEDKFDVFFPNMSTKQFNEEYTDRLIGIILILVLAISLVLAPVKTVVTVFFILNIFYFIINVSKFYIFFKALRNDPGIHVSDKQVEDLKDEKLPVYTLLVPLKSEASVVPKLVENLFNINYPKDRLDIKFISEVTDHTTIDALNKYGIGVENPNASPISLSAEMIKVPEGSISTKPRSCNYALTFARGTYVTIYDAEDKPEVDQLKKIIIGFNSQPLNTVCIQARLNYYNSRKNLLTRFFSLEYGFWYDYFLPGLQEVKSPIPLGGTSNHFKTDLLKKLGAWDPYNVTEDAELGLRVARMKFRTSLINAMTYEEASSSIMAWIKQRTRWQKGFLITFIVHTSKPVQLIRDLGFPKFMLSLLTFGGSFFLPLFNPILWVLFITSLLGLLPAEVKLISSTPETAIAIFNLVIGNSAYIFFHLLSARKSNRKDLAIYSFLLPVYWILISIATLRAGLQFFTNRTKWEKTRHGVG